ncbi:sodium-coupled monocarboxylate transporter 2 isoform X2 [Tetranychus urticae]|uniref:sodium-coupled monocarboxylate transporter 2 isoform X2 n=1 Tax=Tetranychus urticae TaxID=32264 RepID=UPI00077B98D0|nr:sodium-coupled monocarboxylate transporter 2 isoform X2 [Tetranychus urticae]
MNNQTTIAYSKHNFTIIDYLVFAALLAVSSGIGVFFWCKDRKKANNSAYLTGNRNLSVIPVALSLAASFMSTNTILGVPAEVYLLGTQYSVHMISFLIAILLASYIFMPLYYDLNVISVNKYLSLRFQSPEIRIIGSLGFILATLPYMGVVLYGPSLALSSVTPLSVNTSILVVGAICTFYTTMGGIKAVIWSDVIQFFLMLNCLLMVVIVGSFEMGFVEPWRIANQGGRVNFFNFDFNIYRNDNFWVVFLGSVIGWTGVYCSKQTQVQRYCCLESKEKARQALFWNVPGVLVIAILAIWSGIIIYAKYHACDPISLGIVERHDQMMPLYVQDTLSRIPGLSGVFVVGVFSGSLSTLSSGYNALATLTWDDFLRRHFSGTTDQTQARITKGLSALYGLSSIGIAFFIGRLGTVLQASAALVGAISGPLLALFTLGIFIPFGNAKGAIGGFLSGLIISLFMALGAVFNLRPKIRLPVSTDNCSYDISLAFGSPISPDPYIKPWEYKPELLNFNNNWYRH